MVKIGNNINEIAFSPTSDYQRLQLDIVRVSEFLRADSAVRQRTWLLPSTFEQPHRLDFYLWLYVESGECRQMVDFQDITLKTGEWQLIHPKQVHHFLPTVEWDGWVIVFQSEVLNVNQMPWFHQLMQLERVNRVSAENIPWLQQQLRQMNQTAQFDLDLAKVQLLLATQLVSLLAFLSVTAVTEEYNTSHQVQRLQRFKQLMESHFIQQKDVQFYADKLGCTPKTLSQTCRQLLGQSAKNVILHRTLLEAKRLLVHSAYFVSQISYQLGFNETTNFGKFFKKYTQMTPNDFRRKYDKR